MVGFVTLACTFFDQSAELGPERDGSGRVVSPGQIEVLELRVGDCFNNLVRGEVEVVTAVPCTEAHEFEVFHAFDLPDGPSPEPEVMADLWIDGCLAEFEAFVATPFAESVLDISGIFPTEETWAAGDREVICSVTAVDGEPRTGSARNSGV